MTDSYKSKLKFRHQVFVHIHILCISNTPQVFVLNIDTVNAETTVSGKEMHMHVDNSLCKKVFSHWGAFYTAL